MMLPCREGLSRHTLGALYRLPLVGGKEGHIALSQLSQFYPVDILETPGTVDAGLWKLCYPSCGSRLNNRFRRLPPWYHEGPRRKGSPPSILWVKLLSTFYLVGSSKQSLAGDCRLGTTKAHGVAKEL